MALPWGKKAKAERQQAFAASVDSRLGELAQIQSFLASLKVESTATEELSEFLSNADERRIRWGKHTVAALIGGSGSGKSALFNALAGTELREVSIRRPTSTHLGAALWAGEAGESGEQGSDGVLTRLGVSERTVAQTPGPQGLILIDTPDMDSVATEHWELARELAQSADVLVWVVDPQKYADQQLHRNFVANYAHLAPLTIVVLTHADLLSNDEQRQIITHLRQLMPPQIPIVAASAPNGTGLPELMEHLSELAADHKAAYQRLHEDGGVIATKLLEQFPLPHHIHPLEVTPDLGEELATAAGMANVLAVHRRVLKRQYRLRRATRIKRGGTQTLSPAQAGAAAAMPRTEVDENQRRRIRRILQDRVAKWAQTIGEPWAQVLTEEAGVPQAGDELANALSSAWSLTGENAPRAMGARFLRAFRGAGLAVALLGGLWLLADVAGPLIQIYLSDPPIWTIGSIGKFGAPIVLLVAGLALWFAGQCMTGLVRAIAFRTGRRRLVRTVSEVTAQQLRTSITENTSVHLHTLGQYRASMLRLGLKSH